MDGCIGWREGERERDRGLNEVREVRGHVVVHMKMKHEIENLARNSFRSSLVRLKVRLFITAKLAEG